MVQGRSYWSASAVFGTLDSGSEPGRNPQIRLDNQPSAHHGDGDIHADRAKHAQVGKMKPEITNRLANDEWPDDRDGVGKR